MDASEIIRAGLTQLADPPAPPLPDGTIERLAALASLLGDWSPRINLTGHRGQDEIARHLVVGAAALLAELPPFASLADLGTGAGFPGFPIAILHPRARVLLVDSREKRHHFQRAVVRELGLENVELLRGRIEALVPRPCDVVVAQALARPSNALALMRGWAVPGGTIVIPGSAESEPEIPDDPGIVGEVRRYQVPLGGPARTVWLGRVG